MNIWEHPQMIAAEALRHLEDSLIITAKAARDLTSEFTTTANGWKVGESVSFRTHGEYAVKEFTPGGNIETQPIATSTRPLTIEKFFDISVEVGARESKLDFDSFSDQVLRPAAYAMAEKCDAYVGTKILQGQGLYSSANLLDSAADVALARKAANYQQLDMDRFCIVDDLYEAILLGQTWFNQSQTRGNPGITTLQTGNMGSVMGMDFDGSLQFPEDNQVAGDGAGVTNNAIGSENAIGQVSIATTATTGTFNAGDHIMIAGVRRPLIVKTTTASTATNIPITDPITEVIPTGAAITVIGSGTTYDVHGAIFDSRSLGVAFPMLELPEDRVAAVASNKGVSIRIVKGYDLTKKVTTMSMDLLCGAFALDPRRITLLAKEA